MTGLKRDRGMVVAMAGITALCIASTVYSYHYGYLQGTRETIENSSMEGIVPEKFAPMPTAQPIEVKWHFRRNASGVMEFTRTV